MPAEIPSTTRIVESKSEELQGLGSQLWTKKSVGVVHSELSFRNSSEDNVSNSIRLMASNHHNCSGRQREL